MENNFKVYKLESDGDACLSLAHEDRRKVCCVNDHHISLYNLELDE